MTIDEMLETLACFEVSRCNGAFQHLLLKNINERGKSFESMTVAELRGVVESTNSEFNILWDIGSSKAWS